MKMKTATKLVSILALVFAISMTRSASASPIPILNPGFESPATPMVTSTVTSWTQTVGVSGVWNINADPSGYWTVSAPEGNQIAFISTGRPGSPGPAAISQILTATLQANTLYTLTGFVGDPIGFAAGTVSTVSLIAGLTTVATLPISAPAGTFTPFSLTFNSDSSLLVGQALQIQLSSNQEQSGFDAIALNATPVPVPSSIWLLMSGGLWVAGFGLRKARATRR